MATPESSSEIDRLRRQADMQAGNGQWHAAQMLLEALLRLDPSDTAASIDLADVLSRQGQLQVSSRPLLQAMRQLPKDAPLVIELAQRLLARGEVVAARECLAFVAQAPNPPPALLVSQARLRFSIGEIAAARLLIEKAIAAGADAPDAHHMHAMLLQFSGDIEQACAVLERCLQRWPNFADAAVVLANLRKQKPASPLLNAVEDGLRRLPEHSDQPEVQFARAGFEYAAFKIRDDNGQRDAAWAALQRCNQLMHRLNPYDAEGRAAAVDALIGMPNGQDIQHGARPSAGPTPIFIVGLPRSGTTLLDRMLSGHSQVISAGEINDFWIQLHAVADVPPAGNAGFIRLVQRSAQIDVAQLSARYLAQTQWRAQGRDYFIDKLPANIQLVAFIRRALPQAKILHMTRDPMDTCFSNYKTMFGHSAAYSYDLQAMAWHYAQYRRLVRHWHASMPGAMLDVPYAALVTDSESSMRAVLAHCGLDIEQGCLSPERNPAPVATPSNAQVREPIHRRGVDQWRSYASQLEPLRLALAAHGCL